MQMLISWGASEAMESSIVPNAADYLRPFEMVFATIRCCPVVCVILARKAASLVTPPPPLIRQENIKEG